MNLPDLCVIIKNMIHLYSLEDNRRLFIAFAFSVFLHLFLFISLRLRPDFRFLSRKADAPNPSDVIQFNLIAPEPPLIVDTPEGREEILTEPTNILSDRDVVSKDMLEGKESITDTPWADGKLNIKEVDKSIPSIASIPQREIAPVPPSPQPPREKAEEQDIRVLPREETLREDSPVTAEVPSQKETVASLPKEVLRLPLYDGRLSNAYNFGSVSFNVKRHDVAPYIIKMKKRIEEYWAPPVLFTYYGKGGETVIQFKIMPDGKVEDVKVITEKGDESLKKSSLQAILDASPFDPIPQQILAEEKYLAITFTFYYIIDNPLEQDEGDT